MIDLKFKLCMMYRNWTMHVMLLCFKILCWFCVEAGTLLHKLFLAGLDCTKDYKCHSWPRSELFLAGLDCTKLKRVKMSQLASQWVIFSRTRLYKRLQVSQLAPQLPAPLWSCCQGNTSTDLSCLIWKRMCLQRGWVGTIDLWGFCCYCCCCTL